MTLHRLVVESYDSDMDDWDRMGQVLLPDFAVREEVEHALAALGLYCPRGGDDLCWDYKPDEVFGMIHDANGEPMVRMREVEPKLER